MKKVIVIAEAGVNHNGDLKTAFKLVDAAADAGVDYVKFQTFKADNLVSKDATVADYQKLNMGKGHQTQYDMLKKLELSFDDHHRLVEYAQKKNIRFFSTAFDFESLDFLKTLQMGLWKIPSGEITNLPYLEYIGCMNTPVILSTGMAEKAEVAAAIEALLKSGLQRQKLTVLHCNTEYPTPFCDVNLRAMVTMGTEFDVSYGYSDHTLGIEVPIAATALGATVIEKHFTLDRNLPGPDHKASLEPLELKAMVSGIRNIEVALGSFDKIVTSSENKNLIVGRKSIVAKKIIKKGEILTVENLTTCRPGGGISPMRWYDVLGTPAARDFNPNEKIVL